MPQSSKEVWFGIGKLTEECGELQQVIGKAMAFPIDPHPDSEGPLHLRFIDEISDVLAASDYFIERNNLPQDHINDRRQAKLNLFRTWNLSGIRTASLSLDTEPSK
jgi:hypothetical protein